MNNRMKQVLLLAAVMAMAVWMSFLVPALYNVVMGVIAGWQVGGWAYEFASKRWPVNG